jgi:hypothetical protein
MRTSLSRVDDLLAALGALPGQRVLIREALTRDRPSYDRQATTFCQFYMQVQEVETWFSGAHARLWGSEGSEYDIALLAVAAAHRDENGTLTVTEQFESKTERRTIIERAV